jgi:hypothetical protein
MIMKREDIAEPEVVELGSVTELTRGPWGHYADDVLMQDMEGLSDN